MYSNKAMLFNYQKQGTLLYTTNVVLLGFENFKVLKNQLSTYSLITVQVLSIPL